MEVAFLWKHEAELKRKWLGKVPATPWRPLVRTGVQAEDRGCGVCSAPGSGGVGWGALDWIGRGVLSEGDHPATVHVH